MKQKLTTSIDQKEVETLKRELYQQKNDKYLMGQEINELKSELKRMKAEFDRQKDEMKKLNSVEISRTQ